MTHVTASKITENATKTIRSYASTQQESNIQRVQDVETLKMLMVHNIKIAYPTE